MEVLAAVIAWVCIQPETGEPLVGDEYLECAAVISSLRPELLEEIWEVKLEREDGE